MGRITDLPYQLLVDGIIAQLDTPSLLNLSLSCKVLHQVGSDEIVWQRRIAQDYLFPLGSSARVTGWKALYRALSNPELYTWGDIGEGRLGVELRPQVVDQENNLIKVGIGIPSWNVISRLRCVPFPLRVIWHNAKVFRNELQRFASNRLQFERPPDMNLDDEENMRQFFQLVPAGLHEDHNINVGVPVEIHAGGWSFCALTHLGQILAWGSSSGGGRETALGHNIFSAPTLLDLEGRTAVAVSCGREHIVAQMDDGNILEWSKRWDRPALHTPSTITNTIATDNPSHHVHIRQVESGWDFTAILVDLVDKKDNVDSSRNEVILWRTEWTDLIERREWYNTSLNTDQDDLPRSWLVSVPTISLPPLPEQIKKFCAGDNFIIALAASGKVYYLEIPETTLQLRDRLRDTMQETVRHFHREMVRKNTAWKHLVAFGGTLGSDSAGRDSPNIWRDPALNHLVKDPLKITHISAQFQSFAVYAPKAGKTFDGPGNDNAKGAGVVLLGKKSQLDEPIVIPQLQGRNIIKVVHGDWHSGALTQDGYVLTWGSQSNGALGTWDGIPVAEGSPSLLEAENFLNATGTGVGHHATGVFQRIMRMRQQQYAEPRLDPSEEERQRNSMKHMVDAEKRRFFLRRLPDQIEEPVNVRFGFPRLGKQKKTAQGELVEVQKTDDNETKFVFDIAFAGWHSGALAVDRSLIW